MVIKLDHHGGQAFITTHHQYSAILFGTALVTMVTHSAGTHEVVGLTVKAFARPEDVSADNAYRCSPWTVYATSTLLAADPEHLRGCCHVTLADEVQPGGYQSDSLSRNQRG